MSPSEKLLGSLRNLHYGVLSVSVVHQLGYLLRPTIKHLLNAIQRHHHDAMRYYRRMEKDSTISELINTAKKARSQIFPHAKVGL